MNRQQSLLCMSALQIYVVVVFSKEMLPQKVVTWNLYIQ